MDIYADGTEQWRIDLIENPPKTAEMFSKEEWRHIVLNELVKTYISVKPFLGRKHTEETRRKMSLSAMGNQRTPKGYKFVNRKPRTPSPEELARREQKIKNKENKGYGFPGLKWWNNGIITTRCRIKPEGNEWISGRLCFSKNRDEHFESCT